MSPRPRKFRFCRQFNGADFYKPRGIPLSMLELVDLSVEELEALRLCDFEELEQEEAAKKMDISRATFQRDLYSARKKVADALLHSKAIKINKTDAGRAGRRDRESSARTESSHQE